MPTALDRMRKEVQLVVVVAVLCAAGCGRSTETTTSEKPRVKPDFVLRDDQTHNISVIKNGRAIQEVQYETDAYYATTGFATTLEEAVKKATRYMIDCLVEVRGMSRDDAYMLCSLGGNLEIVEAVDTPNMLVAMHLPKSILARSR
jgi:acetamidase/formamidase